LATFRTLLVILARISRVIFCGVGQVLDFQVGQFQEFNFFEFGGNTVSYVDMKNPVPLSRI
jgi:hypothetical protein